MANLIRVIAGQRSSGKTNTGKNILNAYYDQHGGDHKILIIDTTDHPQYQHISVIDPHFVEAWTSNNGIYRCFSAPPPGLDTDWHLEKVMSKDKYSRLNFTNGLLMVEDATKLLDDKLQKYIKIFLADTKQHNVDVIFMFHGFGFIPRRLWKFTDEIVIHKTVETFSQLKGNIPAAGLIEPVFNEVQNHPNPYYCKSVRLT